MSHCPPEEELQASKANHKSLSYTVGLDESHCSQYSECTLDISSPIAENSQSSIQTTDKNCNKQLFRPQSEHKGSGRHGLEVCSHIVSPDLFRGFVDSQETQNMCCLISIFLKR